MPVTLIYDTECYFCTNYTRLLKLKETAGEVKLISARDKAAVEALGCSHLDLNEGMVLLMDGKTYYGYEAIHHLALLTTNLSIFNRINYMIFRHPLLARLLYPMLKMGRRAYLKLAGKELI